MKLKEKMPPSKKMQKPGKMVKGINYPVKEEEYDKKQRKKVTRTDSIAKELKMAKEGYSKEPRVKPSKKK